MSPPAPTLLRKDWLPSHHFRAWDLTFTVRTNSHELDRLIPYLYPHYQAEPSRGPQTIFSLVQDSLENPASQPFALYEGERLVESRPTLRRLFALVERAITHYMLDRQRSLLILHAGGCRWQGRGVLFIGKKWAGKTTMALHFLRRGAQIIDDDVLLLEPGSARAVPFGRPMLVSQDTLEWFPERRGDLIPCGPGSPFDEFKKWYLQPVFEGVRLKEPVALDYVIFLEGERQETPTHLEPLGESEALGLLMASLFSYKDYDGIAVDGLIHLVRTARCFRLTGGWEEDGATVVQARMSDEQPEASRLRLDNSSDKFNI